MCKGLIIAHRSQYHPIKSHWGRSPSPPRQGINSLPLYLQLLTELFIPHIAATTISVLEIPVRLIYLFGLWINQQAKWPYPEAYPWLVYLCEPYRVNSSLESLFIVKKWNWTISISAGYSAIYVNSVNLVPIQGYDLIYVGASSGHPGRVLIGSIVPQNIITGTTDACMAYLPCYAKETQSNDTVYAVAIYKKVL